MQDDSEQPSPVSSTSLFNSSSFATEEDVKKSKKAAWVLIKLPSSVLVDEGPIHPGGVIRQRQISEYYYNRLTNRIVWVLPKNDDSDDDEDEEEEDELFVGWSEREVEGKRVYWNETVNITSLSRPKLPSDYRAARGKVLQTLILTQ
jgi:hypothetical protein